MARLGEALRAERERRGLSLDQAAEDTRIREKFLRAIESGDYQTLPGAVYTRGFLRNYAHYLGLDPDDLVAQFQAERGTPDAPRSFEPMRPIMRRNVILTPIVLLPIVVLAGVALFVGYFYYQFTTFAVPPRLEITEPRGDAIVQTGSYTIAGTTTPDAQRITIRVSPGGQILSDVRPGADGSFSAEVALTPGANHIEVEVLDATGKQNEASRIIRYEAAAASPSPTPGAAIRLAVTEPPNGTAYANALVPVTGEVAPGTTVLVNDQPVTVRPDGLFGAWYSLPAGAQTLRIVARGAGGEASETRSVSVSYSGAFVWLRVQGADAWIQTFVDGAQTAGTGRVLSAGQELRLSGSQILVRSGNGGATFVSFNGQALTRLGDNGQVVERAFP